MNLYEIIATVALIFIMAITFSMTIATTALKSEAIQHKCARYAPTTGQFEWIGASK